jgi:hypothetical protein
MREVFYCGMDSLAEKIEEAFQPIYGIPCWNPVHGYGTCLSLEFGEPYLNIREPRAIDPGDLPLIVKTKSRRHIDVRGDWTLMIYMCDWAVHTKGKRVGHSNLNGSRRAPIERGARELEGQAIVKVTFNPGSLKTSFEFDLGSILTTRPYTEDVEQWWLSSRNGCCFGIDDKGMYTSTSDDCPTPTSLPIPAASERK